MYTKFIGAPCTRIPSLQTSGAHQSHQHGFPGSPYLSLFRGVLSVRAAEQSQSPKLQALWVAGCRRLTDKEVTLHLFMSYSFSLPCPNYLLGSNRSGKGPISAKRPRTQFFLVGGRAAGAQGCMSQFGCSCLSFFHFLLYIPSPWNGATHI